MGVLNSLFGMMGNENDDVNNEAILKSSGGEEHKLSQISFPILRYYPLKESK